MALMDGSDVLASAQRYDLMGMLDQCPVRICGVGTVFGDPALRDRSHARVLVEQLVDEAGRNGADLALVFWPPDSGSHVPDGFDVMPMMEVELKVKEPSRYGAPMMLVRDGDNRDLAAVVAMGRVQAGQFRFHVDRDLDLVKYAITRKRLLAGLAPTGTRQLRFVIAEEGITAAAYVVISIVGRAWMIEECGDRVPHPVSWTHVYATRHGVARIARALRAACDTPASRGASTGCSVRRTQRRPRAPRRGFERPGRRRLAP